MNRLQAAVLEFNKKGGQYVAEQKGMCNAVVMDNQMHLLQEEIDEAVDSYNKGDFIETLDGLVDSLYVLLHFFNMMGVDLESLFDEVHASNMSKADPETGEFIMKDGKIQKGPAYRKPDLESVLEEASAKFKLHNLQMIKLEKIKKDMWNKIDG
jgi:predicted HAD superfamily Cof-like phosphohydrolase